MRVTISPDVFATLDRLKASVHQVIFAASMDLATDLMVGTPVDTGYAANSWQALANGSPGLREGFEGSPAGQIDAAVIWESVGGVLTLANTAEYIIYLADGSSPQAPAGWVEHLANQYEDYLARHVMEANAS